MSQTETILGIEKYQENMKFWKVRVEDISKVCEELLQKKPPRFIDYRDVLEARETCEKMIQDHQLLKEDLSRKKQASLDSLARAERENTDLKATLAREEKVSRELDKTLASDQRIVDTANIEIAATKEKIREACAKLQNLRENRQQHAEQKAKNGLARFQLQILQSELGVYLLPPKPEDRDDSSVTLELKTTESESANQSSLKENAATSTSGAETDNTIFGFGPGLKKIRGYVVARDPEAFKASQGSLPALEYFEFDLRAQSDAYIAERLWDIISRVRIADKGTTPRPSLTSSLSSEQESILDKDATMGLSTKTDDNLKINSIRVEESSMEEKENLDAEMSMGLD